MSTLTGIRAIRFDVAPVARRGSLARHTSYLTVRALRTLRRQPAYAAMTVVQPVIWLLLFGRLFKSVIHVPGFTTTSGSYLEFITPGVIVMTALFSSGWAGTVYIEDMNRGVMDRMLASPVRRGAMMIGTLAYQGLTTVLQTLVVFGITVVAATLIAVIAASLSNALALLLRQQEVLIGISQFIVLPLQFVSSAIMDTRLSPAWVRDIARYNPVDRVVVSSRQALSAHTDWGAVGPRLGLLIALATVMAWLATRAFDTYQRPI